MQYSWRVEYVINGTRKKGWVHGHDYVDALIKAMDKFGFYDDNNEIIVKKVY